MALSPAHQKLLDTLDDIFASLHHFTARMVATLAAIEVEGVHEELGYTSLMEFCMKRYGMTVEEARLRVGVARLIQRFPQMLQPLDKGVVTMSNLSLLRNMVKESNVDVLLALVSNTSKEGAKEALAEHFPKPPKDSSLKKRRTDAETGLPRRPEIEPTAADEYELLLRIDRVFRDLIEEMRERTQSANPTGDLTALTFMAFQALQEKLNKQQYKATNKPAANPRPSNDPTFITAAVKRAVVARDGGRCTFVGAEGFRCEARGNLQFDHIDLRCRGGLGTVENVRLRCDVHNLHGAKKALGKEFVDKKIAEAKVERATKAKAKAEVAASTSSSETPEIETLESSSPVAGPTSEMHAAETPRDPTAHVVNPPVANSHDAEGSAISAQALESSPSRRSIAKAKPNAKASVQTRSKVPGRTAKRARRASG